MSQHLQNIVVGTSLELASDPVVRGAYELARRSQAKLHLFHAHSLPIAYFAAPSGLTAVSPDLLDSERQVRQQLLEQQLDRIELPADAIHQVVIEAGAPHRMLLQLARNVGADLLVVGANESDDLPVLGSTADRVLRQTTCPVWVLDGQAEVPPRTILAPVDLSPLSEECLRLGLRLMDEIGDPKPAVDALFVLTPEEVEGHHQFSPGQIRRLADEELASFLERVDPEKRRTINPEVREGDIRGEILSDVQEKPIDLVIVGTHGRSGFERFLLGSVAADIASRAGTSVLVIPPCSVNAESGAPS